MNGENMKYVGPPALSKRTTRSHLQLDRSYLRLDGAMAQGVRQKVVRKFTTSEKSIVLLASLKAGGVGLNLVRITRVNSDSSSTTLTKSRCRKIAANHVYLMDTW